MEFVTDRTEADVLLGNPKGKYKPSDLNRVERAVAVLCRLAAQLDCDPGLVTKTDWGVTERFTTEQWPAGTQMSRYINNVRSICAAIGVNTANLPSSMDDLTWEDANNIEKCLEAAYTKANQIISIFQFSGEIFAGEEIGI